MPEEPEEFKGKESRLSLLHMEKRFVDTELVVEELKKKVEEIPISELKEKVEELSELKQRLEDLEDLIMVEQAGIIELKKVMEAGAVPEVTVSKEFEERIGKVEETLASLLAAPPKEGVDTSNLQKQMQLITNEINYLRTDLEKVKRMPVERPGVDVQFLTSKIDSMKATIDELASRKVETDLKVQTFERLLTELQAAKSAELPGNILNDVKNLRKEWLMVSGRVDSVERVLNEISEAIPRLEAKVGKFESLERASLISKELSDKLEQFKFIENEVKKLSSRIEMIYDSIDKRLEKFRDAERKIPELIESISGLGKEMEKNRVDILRKAKKEDVDNVMKEVEKRLSEIKPEGFERIVEPVNSRLEQLEKMVVELDESYRRDLEEVKSIATRAVTIPFETQINELIEKAVLLESRVGAIEKMIRVQPIILE